MSVVVVPVLVLILVSPVRPAYTKPNIIMVVADDLVRIYMNILFLWQTIALYPQKNCLLFKKWYFGQLFRKVPKYCCKRSWTGYHGLNRFTSPKTLMPHGRSNLKLSIDCSNTCMYLCFEMAIFEDLELSKLKIFRGSPQFITSFNMSYVSIIWNKNMTIDREITRSGNFGGSRASCRLLPWKILAGKPMLKCCCSQSLSHSIYFDIGMGWC